MAVKEEEGRGSGHVEEGREVRWGEERKAEWRGSWSGGCAVGGGKGEGERRVDVLTC
jgi:hypothetical protein